MEFEGSVTVEVQIQCWLNVPTDLVLCLFSVFWCVVFLFRLHLVFAPLPPSSALGLFLMEQKGCHSSRSPSSNHTIQGKGDNVSVASAGEEVTCSRKPSKPQYLLHCPATCLFHFNILPGTLLQVRVHASILCASPAPCIKLESPGPLFLITWLHLCITQASRSCVCRKLALCYHCILEAWNKKPWINICWLSLNRDLIGCSPRLQQWLPPWEKAWALSSRVRSRQRSESD